MQCTASYSVFINKICLPAALTLFGAIDAFAGSQFSTATPVAEEQVADMGSIGETAEISRTITVTITDNGFSPNLIKVRKGETVRFLLKNESEFVRQFSIGTPAMQMDQRMKMKELVEHGVLEPGKINHLLIEQFRDRGAISGFNDPHSVLLEPGKSGEICWKFGSVSELEFASNIPGHYEAGMVGRIDVDRMSTQNQ